MSTIINRKLNPFAYHDWEHIALLLDCKLNYHHSDLSDTPTLTTEIFSYYSHHLTPIPSRYLYIYNNAHALSTPH